MRIRTVWCVCGEEEGCPAPRRRKTRPLSRNEPFWSQAAPLVVTLLKSKWVLFHFKHGYSLSKSHLSGVCLPLSPPAPQQRRSRNLCQVGKPSGVPSQTPFCVSLLPFLKTTSFFHISWLLTFTQNSRKPIGPKCPVPQENFSSFPSTQCFIACLRVRIRHGSEVAEPPID